MFAPLNIIRLCARRVSLMASTLKSSGLLALTAKAKVCPKLTERNFRHICLSVLRRCGFAPQQKKSEAKLDVYIPPTQLLQEEIWHI